MRTIVVGSRQSALALTQTGQVIDDLKRLAKEHGLDYDFTVKKSSRRATAYWMLPSPR